MTPFTRNRHRDVDMWMDDNAVVLEARVHQGIASQGERGRFYSVRQCESCWSAADPAITKRLATHIFRSERKPTLLADHFSTDTLREFSFGHSGTVPGEISKASS